MRLRLECTALLLIAACSPAPSPPGPAGVPAAPARAPAVPAAPLALPQRERAPAAGSDRGCEVAVRTRVVTLGQGRFELIARAANETDQRIEAVLSHACPGAAARFEGLPASYDVGDQCRAGACASGAFTRLPLALPPGESREIARVAIDAHAGACNAALPAGRYSIGASVELTGARSCTTSRGVFEHALTPQQPAPHPAPSVLEPRRPKQEPCPAVACRYTPCPPGVSPPQGCAGACGCTGSESQPSFVRVR